MGSCIKLCEQHTSESGITSSKDICAFKKYILLTFFEREEGRGGREISIGGWYIQWLPLT